jgi:sodium/hydrogen antiporter
VRLEVVLLVAAALTLFVGGLTTLLKRVWLTGPLVALGIGVLLGPGVLGRLDADPHLVMRLAEVTLAISLVATGLQMQRRDLRAIARPATLLLTLGMAGMWVVTGLGAWLLLDVPFWVGALIGAILTPTDPVIASTVVAGDMAEENLPRKLRRTLQFEAGANDGLAVAFVLLPAIVLDGSADSWVLESLQQVGVAVVVGAAAGVLTAWAIDALEHRGVIEQPSLLPLGVALALVVLAGVNLLGGSGILAAFVAGLALSLTLDERFAEELEEVQEGVERALILPVFALFGALLASVSWGALGLAGWAFAVWALVLRRTVGALPALALARLSGRDRAFLGWFGPLGVAAIFYLLHVDDRYAIDRYDEVLAACTMVITLSVVVHSLTATPGVRRYAGRSAWTTLRHPLRPGVEREP